MGYSTHERKQMVFEYDFASDGGAVSTIDLTQISGNALLAGCRVTDVFAIVETAFTSAGTPTVTFGNTADTDGYMADTYALLAAGTSLRGGEVAGALIWDDTNDHSVLYSPTAANDLDMSMTIGTAAVTAGKLKFIVEYFSA